MSKPETTRVEPAALQADFDAGLFELTHENVERWLREEDDARLAKLYAAADRVRREHVGQPVHLRGLIEISNHCVRQCAYCGLRQGREGLQRYRMSADEIIACAHEAVRFGFGTVVLQAGEDYGLTREFIAGIVRQIKAETPLAVTLSLGERPEADLKAWRAAGADRYLLRIETSDPLLYAQIHPPLKHQPDTPRAESAFEVPRVGILRTLRHIGYEIGSGVMIGIPGQSYAMLARDILLFRSLDLDMIGVGPYIAHPETPLGQTTSPLSEHDQVPNTERMTYKVLALTRLACPEANLPSTTALATLNRKTGRELGLSRGANIVMPNLTPVEYRAMYEIYPAKACIAETAECCRHCLTMRIRSLGRPIGAGTGGRQRT